MSRTQCPKCGANRGIQTGEEGEYCHAGCGWISRTKSFSKYLDTRLTRQDHEFTWSEGRSKEIDLYFLKKGIPIETLEYFEVGSAGVDRYVVPIKDCENEISCVYAKYIVENKSPRHYCAGARMPYVHRHADSSVMVIVEDLESFMKLYADYNVCALLGTGHRKTLNLKEVLKHSPYYPIKIWLDSDQAGYNAAKRLAHRLDWEFHDIEIIQTTKDPKNYSRDQIQEILR